MASRSADKRRSVKQEKEEKQEIVDAAATSTAPTSEEENSDEKVPPKKSKVKIEKEEASAVKEKPQKVVKSTSQASYIMKLFDRSVNLAKFEESSSLYPLCRAWMQNAPRQLTPRSEALEPATSTDDGDVAEMPRVRIRKGGKPLVNRKVDVKIDEIDKEIEAGTWTKEKLLEFHRSGWEAERQRHIDNSRNFEEKHFAANFELLESLQA